MAWNGSDSEKVKAEGQQRNGKKHSLTAQLNYKALVAGFAVVLIGGLSAWLTLGRVRTPASPSLKTSVAQTRISPNRPQVVAADVVSNAVVAQVAAKPVVTDNVTRVRQTVQMRTLEDGTKVPLSKPYFTNHIERALSTLCNPGGMAIPLSSALRRFSDDEIMRILKSPMEYDKNDSEFIMARKMEMQRVKGEILDYVADGHTLKEALSEIDKTIRRDSSYRMMMRRSMQEALATGDAEVIRKYAQTLNEKLEQKGQRPFEVPKPYRSEEEQGTKRTIEE